MPSVYSQCSQCKTIYPNAPAACPACGSITFNGIEEKRGLRKKEEGKGMKTTKYFVTVSVESDDPDWRRAYEVTHPNAPPLQLPCKISSEETEISSEIHTKILNLVMGRSK